MFLDRSWNDRRWSISSMLSMLFSGRVFIHLPSHRKMAVLGMPSPKLQTWKRVHLLNNQTKTPNGVKTFTFRLVTATSVLSMEDVDNWWSWSEWEGGMSQNYHLSLFQKLSSGTSANHYFPLRRDYLFTFMLCHHLLKQAPETERARLSWFMHCV